MKSSYALGRPLWIYLGGTAASRAGDEMAGPALLLAGFAVTGRPSAGSALLAALTIAAAVGGPLFGVLLDRSPRPDRVLALTLAAYALGVIAVAAAVGRLPVPIVVLIALAAGLFNPAVAGGWTSQLPGIVAGPALSRGFALDAMTYSVASLAGPALAALVAAAFGARTAVIVAAALAVPSARSLSRYPPAPLAAPGPHRQAAPRLGLNRRAAPRPGLNRQVAAGFAAIATRRLLLRATVTSVVSYVGIGMLLVSCPVLGAQRLGGPARGALLISAIAAASLVANSVLARRQRRPDQRSRQRRPDQRSRQRRPDQRIRQRRPDQHRRPPRGQPDTRVLASTLVIGVSMAAAAVAPGWLTMAAVALGGAGEGPQLTALFAVRHRESPEQMRGQIFTTAASLKIGGLAAGAALAGPLAGRSVTACLLVAAGFELCAAAAYVLIAPPPEAARPAPPPEAAEDQPRRRRRPDQPRRRRRPDQPRRRRRPDQHRGPGGRHAPDFRRVPRPVRKKDCRISGCDAYRVPSGGRPVRTAHLHPCLGPSGWTAFFHARQACPSGLHGENDDDEYGASAAAFG